MKKKSVGQIFIRVFLQSFFIMIILIGVGVASYKLTTYYYKITEKEVSAEDKDAVKDIVDDVKIDRVSKNLIYHVDSKTGEIKHLILEIFSMDTYNLDYITIPVNTEFAMSNELYQRIYANHSDVPQIVKISNMSEYFSKDTKYSYGALLIEDLLGVDISYYTVLEDTVYNQVFTEDSLSQMDTEKEAERKQIFTDDFYDEMEHLTDEALIIDYLESFYKKIESNLTIKNKLKYAASYVFVNKDYIHFYIIPGTAKESNFTVSIEEAKSLLQEIEKREAYTTSQEDDDLLSGTDSIGKNIRVLNGSGITGLAATYRDMLQEAGYTITGIANYSSSNETNTRILVKEEGDGKDLLKYFKNAVIEVEESLQAADIEIILGKEDGIE